MTYTPCPIKTDEIVLPEELEALTERLAENAHDIWAQGRLKDGWTYGAQRDDARKQHPDLQPYSDLSETEKEYDRRTAMETLKAVLALGYEITPSAEREK